jgi:hypothetical protein
MADKTKKAKAKEKAMKDLGTLLAVAEATDSEAPAVEEESVDALLERMKALEAKLAKAEAKAAQAGKPVICKLDKTDPWVTESKEADALSEMYWVAKATKEKAEALFNRAQSSILEVGMEGCPAEPEVDGRFKTIWYRVGETLFRLTAVKGRVTIDTDRLFAEHPEIDKKAYEKHGTPFFQKRFERTKVL